MPRVVNLKRTFSDKSEERLWMAVLLAVPSLAVLGVHAVSGTPLTAPLDATLANSFLGIVAQVLAGMLAIVFSVSIVAVEITSSRYTPRLFSYFVLSRGTWLTLLSLLGCTLLSVVSIGIQSVPMLQGAFLFMVFFFVFSLLTLPYYFLRTLQLLDPINLANRIRDDAKNAMARGDRGALLNSITSLGDVAIKAFERGEEEVATTYLDRLQELQLKLVGPDSMLDPEEAGSTEVARALGSLLLGCRSPVVDQYYRLFRAAAARKSEGVTLKIAYLLEQGISELITHGGDRNVLWGTLLQYVGFLRMALKTGDASGDRLVRSLANIAMAPAGARTLSEDYVGICLQALEMANRIIVDGEDFELWKAELDQFSTILPGGQARGPFHTDLQTLVYELMGAGIEVPNELPGFCGSLAWAIEERMTPARHRIADLILSYLENLAQPSSERLHKRVRQVRKELDAVRVATGIFDTFFRICVYALARKKHNYIKELWQHVNPPDATAHWVNVNLVNLNVGFLTHQLSVNLWVPWEIDHYHGSDAYVCRYYLLCLALALRRGRGDWHPTVLPFTDESLARGDASSEGLAAELSAMHTFLANLAHHVHDVLHEYQAVCSMIEEWNDVLDHRASHWLNQAHEWLANEGRTKEWTGRAEAIIKDLPIDDARVEGYNKAALDYYGSHSRVHQLAVNAPAGNMAGTELRGTSGPGSPDKEPFTVIGERPQQFGVTVGFEAVGQIVQAEVAHIARTIVECGRIKPVSARHLTFHAVARAAKAIVDAGGSPTVLLAPDGQIGSAWQDDPEFYRHLHFADGGARYLQVDERTALILIEVAGDRAFVLDRNAGEWTVITPLTVEVVEREEDPMAVQVIARETVDYEVRNVAAAKLLDFALSGYARGCLVAYLHGKKDLSWVIGTIRSSQVRGSRLVEIFEELKHSGDSDRYLQARTKCAHQGWL